MYHVDNSSAVSEMPPIGGVFSLPTLWFRNGGEGAAPTYPGQDWFNIVQAELLNVLAAAGIQSDKSDVAQLATAINLLSAPKWVSVDADIEQSPAVSYVFTAGAEIQLISSGLPFWAMVDFSVDLKNTDCIFRAPAGETITANTGSDSSARIVVSGRPFLFYRQGGQWRVSQ